MTLTMTSENTMKVRETVRLRLSTTAERALLAEWGRVRWVWNQCVGRARDLRGESETCGPALMSAELTDWRGAKEWLGGGSCVPQQQIIRDWGRARAKAFADIKAHLPIRQRAGFPTFKHKDKARPTLNYRIGGFRLDAGVLVLAGGIRLRPVWSRDLPSLPSSVRVYRDATGKWWASFVVEASYEQLPPVARAIGVDWGVAETAVTTDAAYDLAHAQHGKRAAKAWARSQRNMARRRPAKGHKPSKGYLEAKHQTAVLYQRVAWKRRDDARKWAKKVVHNHDRLAVEDFKPKFLANSSMARKAADAAIGATKRQLVWAAAKHGRDVRLVDPRYTTMDCGKCGARAKHRLPLSERTYTCCACGHTAPRDRNSAAVMVARAGFDPAGVDRVRHEDPVGLMQRESGILVLQGREDGTSNDLAPRR